MEVREAYTMLYLAPLEGVVAAEQKMRSIWANWLENLVEQGLPSDRFEQVVRDLAPVFTVNGTVKTGLVLRVTGVRKIEAGLDLGLTLGVFTGAGKFGFTSESGHESVFTAETAHNVGERVHTLSDHLGTFGKQLQDGSQVTSIIEWLRSGA